MLKDSMVQSGTPARADFKAAVNCNTGAGVVITDYNTKKFGFPAAATDNDIYVVDKERIPTGINAAYSVFPDSFAEFNTVANGDFAKLRKYLPGDEFKTTEVANANALVNANANAIANGIHLNVDTAGKWALTANSGADASKYTYIGVDNSTATTLYKILVH